MEEAVMPKIAINRITCVLALITIAVLAGCDPTVIVRAPGELGHRDAAKIIVPYYNSYSVIPEPCSDTYFSTRPDELAACETAFQLRDYIYKITGVKLRVEGEQPSQEHKPRSTEIHIGLTSLAQNFPGTPLPLNLLSGKDHEAFLIAARREGISVMKYNRIFLIGKQQVPFYRTIGKATHYAVAEFLEHYLNVHWYLPGPLGEYYAEKNNIKIRPDEPDAFFEPVFWGRTISGLCQNYDPNLNCPYDPLSDARWAELNKGHPNAGRFLIYHNLGELISRYHNLPTPQYPGYPYTEDIAEAWAYADPDPTPDSTPHCQAAAHPNNYSEWQPKLESDPTTPLTKDIIEEMMVYYTDDYNIESYSMGVQDNGWFDCHDQIKHDFLYRESERTPYGIPWRDASGDPDIADNIWHFYNSVTAAWWDEIHPGGETAIAPQWLTARVYSRAAGLPSFKLNVHLMPEVFNEKSLTWIDEGGNQAFAIAQLEDWTEQLEYKGILAAYERLYGAALYMPRYSLKALDESIQWMAESLYTVDPNDPTKTAPAARAYNAEGWPIWPFDGPKFWFVLKKLWDPSLDKATTMRKYYQDMFGAAAGSDQVNPPTGMAGYFYFLEKAYDEWPSVGPYLIPPLWDGQPRYPWTDKDSFYHETHETFTILETVDGVDQFVQHEFPSASMHYREGADYSNSEISDNTGYVKLYEDYLNEMEACLDQAKQALGQMSSIEYYRVLLFERGFKVIKYFTKIKWLDRLMYEPWHCTEVGGELSCRGWKSEDVNEVYDIYVGGTSVVPVGKGFCDMLPAAQKAVEEMIHPPVSQLPSGVASDYIGVPRNDFHSGEMPYQERWEAATDGIGLINANKIIFDLAGAGTPGSSSGAIKIYEQLYHDPQRAADLKQVLCRIAYESYPSYCQAQGFTEPPESCPDWHTPAWTP